MRLFKITFAFLVVLFSGQVAFAWFEEADDQIFINNGAVNSEGAHSTFHYDLTKLLAYQAGFSMAEAETIARYCQLVDLSNTRYANYPYLVAPGFSADFPTWDESLGGTERIGNPATNANGDLTGPFFHFPLRDPSIALTGPMVYGSYPVGPNPGITFWPFPLRYDLTEIMNWGLYGQGMAGQSGNAPVAVVYRDGSTNGRYRRVMPGSLIAMSIFLHAMQDSYSHEECSVQESLRLHTQVGNCNGAYHFEELPYQNPTYGYIHVEKCAQASWRVLREYIAINNLGYAARWTTDANNNQIPDELEDDQDLDWTESFIERWKSPATVDLNGDAVINNYDHTQLRMQLVLDELPGGGGSAKTAAFTEPIARFHLHPNPTHGITRLETSWMETDFSWELLNMKGQIVSRGSSWEISLENQQGGVYLLKVEADGRVEVHKVVKY